MKIINRREGWGLAVSDHTHFLDDTSNPLPMPVAKATIVLESREVVKAVLEVAIEAIEIDTHSVRWMAAHPSLKQLGEVAEIRYRDGHRVEFAEGSGQPTVYADTVDYEKILRAYINHVGSCEGIDFLGIGGQSVIPADHQALAELNEAENRELVRIANEGRL